MSNPLNFEIREQLARYLAREISLHDFEDWFYAETWDIDVIDDISTINMTYDITLLLAEYSSKAWTEDELRKLLRPFITEYALNPSKYKEQHGTSSMNYVVKSSRVEGMLSTNHSGLSVGTESLTVYVS
jgi:hypothetical protein